MKRYHILTLSQLRLTTRFTAYHMLSINHTRSLIRASIPATRMDISFFIFELIMHVVCLLHDDRVVDYDTMSADWLVVVILVFLAATVIASGLDGHRLLLWTGVYGLLGSQIHMLIEQVIVLHLEFCVLLFCGFVLIRLKHIKVNFCALWLRVISTLNQIFVI